MTLSLAPYRAWSTTEPQMVSIPHSGWVSIVDWVEAGLQRLP